MGNFPEDPGFDYGKLYRPRTRHWMPKPIYPVAVHVRYGSQRTQRNLPEQQPNGQGPAGLKARLALLGYASGTGLAQDGRFPFRQRMDAIESRAQQGDFQGRYAVPGPRGRGFGHRHRSPRTDDPLYGGGKKVVRRAVLAIKTISRGPPSALLGKNGRTAHPRSNAPELDQNGIGGF